MSPPYRRCDCRLPSKGYSSCRLGHLRSRYEAGSNSQWGPKPLSHSLNSCPPPPPTHAHPLHQLMLTPSTSHHANPSSVFSSHLTPTTFSPITPPLTIPIIHTKTHRFRAWTNRSGSRRRGEQSACQPASVTTCDSLCFFTPLLILLVYYYYYYYYYYCCYYYCY